MEHKMKIKVVIKGKVEVFTFKADEVSDRANINRCLAFYQHVLMDNKVSYVKSLSIKEAV